MNSGILKLPFPAMELVPHRKGMLLIQTLDEFAEDSAAAQLEVNKQKLFIRNDGSLDPIVYVEFLAQLVAAHSGYESKLNIADPKTGFLVGIKDFKIAGNCAVGDTIQLSIKEDYAFDQISYLTGNITRNNEPIASGTLKLWEQAGAGSVDGSGSGKSVEVSTNAEFNPQWRAVFEQMMLNEHIIKCIRDFNIAGSESIAEMVFEPGFPGFDGHFPGMPILPGVMMLKTGMLIGELMVEHSLLPVNIKQAKFAKSVFPNELIEIKSTVENRDNQFRLSTLITKGGETCAKFSIDCIRN